MPVPKTSRASAMRIRRCQKSCMRRRWLSTRGRFTVNSHRQRWEATMPFLGVLALLIQVGFAVHAIRNGRELYWVVIIIMFPMIGCLVYFFVAVYPTLGIERHARKLSDGIAKAIDHSRAMRARVDDVAACGSLNH